MLPPMPPSAVRPPVHPLAPPPPPPAPGPPTAPAPLDVHDEQEATVLAPARAKPVTWSVLLPDGTRRTIAGTTVVGRTPAKSAYPGSTATLRIADPDENVSKSHGVLEVDADGLWVRDLGSTNGIVVIDATGHEVTATTGQRVAVAGGSEIEFGGIALVAERSDAGRAS